ncbi:hypothetical protein LCGC14_2862170 [marine sediment metagenome]|uniref:Uncharacterized protein n=1 Tax=marine sediment metagenome TaxID=412755 RepID=A0A0F8YS28_9ZZZZ
MFTVEQVRDYIIGKGRKTLYVPKRIAVLAGLDCPSTGRRGNVRGMRNLYWGHDCIVAMQSGYAYKVS